VLAALFAAGTNAFAQTPLARGDYLVNGIGGCNNCHTPRLAGPPPSRDFDKRLSGGFQVFNEPFFAVKGSNITPDSDTGIGKWSDADLKRALTEGKRPNGTPLAMVMPSNMLRVLTPGDLDEMVAYLRSVPAIRNEVQPPVYKTAMPAPALPGAEKPMTDGDLRDLLKRGFYLASIAHCMACHARRAEAEPADFKGNWGGGGRVFKGPFGESVAANVSSSRTKGIGAWSDAEIKRALVEGVSRDGRKLKPPMVDYSQYYGRLTDEDLSALVAWVRTIPPIE
jgi:mono/diheme cytochrome c family protein